MERDDISSRTMVLCVSSVTVTANQAESAGVEQQDNVGEKDGQGTVNNMEVATATLIWLYLCNFNNPGTFLRDSRLVAISIY